MQNPLAFRPNCAISIESLDRRAMFDAAGGVGEPDTTAPFIESASYNYDAPRPSITIDFSEHVDTTFLAGAVVLDAKSLHMRIRPPNIVLAGYDDATDVATLQFQGMLEGNALWDSMYRLTVSEASVRDDAGNFMDDEFRLDFHSLIGDANRDERVGVEDFARLAANFNSTRAVFSQGDFNYDGQVNVVDFSLLAGRFGNSLPPATDLPSAATIATTSTTTTPFSSASPISHATADREPGLLD
jgi:hypothetical protein